LFQINGCSQAMGKWGIHVLQLLLAEPIRRRYIPLFSDILLLAIEKINTEQLQFPLP